MQCVLEKNFEKLNNNSDLFDYLERCFNTIDSSAVKKEFIDENKEK